MFHRISPSHSCLGLVARIGSFTLILGDSDDGATEGATAVVALGNRGKPTPDGHEAAAEVHMKELSRFPPSAGGGREAVASIGVEDKIIDWDSDES